MTIGQQIKEHRTSKKISHSLMVIKLKELGVDVCRQTLISWEKGKTIPKNEHWESIEKVLGFKIQVPK
jgi:DNA-binding XRE family transcriptional regulator